MPVAFGLMYFLIRIVIEKVQEIHAEIYVQNNLGGQTK